MTNGTLKIMKPVMQEVEVTRDELIATLMKRKAGDSKFTVGELVNANIPDTGYGAVNGVAVIMQVNRKGTHHPVTSAKLDKAENYYRINYFDCNNCVKTFEYATDSELTAL
jgi:broad specificity polyphosphatase/5'/3'-nucleotidase SurE